MNARAVYEFGLRLHWVFVGFCFIFQRLTIIKMYELPEIQYSNSSPILLLLLFNCDTKNRKCVVPIWIQLFGPEWIDWDKTRNIMNNRHSKRWKENENLFAYCILEYDKIIMEYFSLSNQTFAERLYCSIDDIGRLEE